MLLNFCDISIELTGAAVSLRMRRRVSQRARNLAYVRVVKLLFCLVLHLILLHIAHIEQSSLGPLLSRLRHTVLVIVNILGRILIYIQSLMEQI